MNEQLSFEPSRGCGLRVLGKPYLMGGTIGISCDRLPMPLVECECCGHKPTFHRGYQKINPKILFKLENEDSTSPLYHKNCVDALKPCQVCQANEFAFEAQSFLLYVGKKYYTPTTFLNEAKELGVSKAISHIPEELEIGKSWVFLAYPEYHESIVGYDIDKDKIEKVKRDAVFHVFIAERIEVLITEEQSTNEDFLKALKDKKITPVIVPKNFTNLHRPKKAVTFATKIYEDWKLEQTQKGSKVIKTDSGHDKIVKPTLMGFIGEGKASKGKTTQITEIITEPERKCGYCEKTITDETPIPLTSGSYAHSKCLHDHRIIDEKDKSEVDPNLIIAKQVIDKREVDYEEALEEEQELTETHAIIKGEKESMEEISEMDIAYPEDLVGDLKDLEKLSKQPEKDKNEGDPTLRTAIQAIEKKPMEEINRMNESTESEKAIETKKIKKSSPNPPVDLFLAVFWMLVESDPKSETKRILKSKLTNDFIQLLLGRHFVRKEQNTNFLILGDFSKEKERNYFINTLVSWFRDETYNMGNFYNNPARLVDELEELNNPIPKKEEPKLKKHYCMLFSEFKDRFYETWLIGQDKEFLSGLGVEQIEESFNAHYFKIILDAIDTNKEVPMEVVKQEGFEELKDMILNNQKAQYEKNKDNKPIGEVKQVCGKCQKVQLRTANRKKKGVCVNCEKKAKTNR